MKTDKSENSRIKRRLKIILVLIFFSGLFSCQVQDDLAPVPSDEDVELKSVKLTDPGEYAPGVGIWDLKLQPSWELIPDGNRYMVVFAHGMVFPEPYEPLELPDDKIGGVPVETIVAGMNFGYATTSYTANGLVAVDAVHNIKNLVHLVKKYMRFENLPLPDYWILAGPSEGGLVTVLTMEKFPELFDGGLTVCGPIGSMYDQVQYMGNFHVLFNYFFGDQLVGPLYIGNPEEGVPASAMNGWYNLAGFDLKTALGGIMLSEPVKTTQLIYCSGSNLDPLDPVATGPALIHLLGYNVMLTNNVTGLLNGCIFNNIGHTYYGSLDDSHLNENIQRVLTKDFRRAKSHLKAYETTGEILAPIVSMHNTGDYLVPYWHQNQYASKVAALGHSDLFHSMTIDRFGHCEVTVPEIESAIAILLSKM